MITGSKTDTRLVESMIAASEERAQLKARVKDQQDAIAKLSARIRDLEEARAQDQSYIHQLEERIAHLDDQAGDNQHLLFALEAEHDRRVGELLATANKYLDEAREARREAKKIGLAYDLIERHLLLAHETKEAQQERAEDIVFNQLKRAFERREWKYDPRTLKDIAGMIAEALESCD